MATGWITWTCLLLAGSTPNDDVVYMPQRGFQIPIRIQQERQNEVKELILYMSSNKGGNWGISARADPRKAKAFDFWAEGDGEYYFNVAVIDAKTGKQDPVNIYNAPVGMKVCVDTVKPVVRLASAERVGDEVQVAWEARDERAEWTSFKLEWRPKDSPGGPWTPLPVTPSERGNHRFRVNVPGDIHVRASLRDLANNEGSDEKIALGGNMRMDTALTQTRNDAPSPPVPTMPSPTPPPPMITSSVPPPPAPVPVTSTPISQPVTQQPPYDSTPITTSNAAPTPTPPAPTAPTGPTRGQLPRLLIVPKRQVKLGFDVTKFGPSGLGSVDVYVTTDEGETWEKVGGDLAVSLPVSPEILNQAPVRGTVTVQVPVEGKVFGYYVIVKSRANLGKTPPGPMTVPQVRVECDTTQPSAELYAPRPEPGRGSSLVLSWKAEDRNLAQNPISLEWSANASGPWEFIGGPELPNTGMYTWNVQSKIPPKVYLKLTVRDAAGNVAVAATPEPVVIDLTVPEVGGVMVIGR